MEEKNVYFNRQINILSIHISSVASWYRLNNRYKYIRTVSATTIGTFLLSNFGRFFLFASSSSILIQE